MSVEEGESGEDLDGGGGSRRGPDGCEGMEAVEERGRHAGGNEMKKNNSARV
jgi:hypothetical protein